MVPDYTALVFLVATHCERSLQSGHDHTAAMKDLRSVERTESQVRIQLRVDPSSALPSSNASKFGKDR